MLNEAADGLGVADQAVLSLRGYEHTCTEVAFISLALHISDMLKSTYEAPPYI
jgi:hypothetical protein